ncbi:MAG: hypothetical protein ACRCYY_05025 [Trueperaceae bacterium]
MTKNSRAQCCEIPHNHAIKRPALPSVLGTRACKTTLEPSTMPMSYTLH